MAELGFETASTSLESSSSPSGLSALSSPPFPCSSSDAFLACRYGRLWVPPTYQHGGCCSFCRYSSGDSEHLCVSGRWPGTRSVCWAVHERLLWVGSAFRVAVSIHRVPNCPLCAPSPIHTQVWPPGKWKGQCGAATEPADSGGLARGIR